MYKERREYIKKNLSEDQINDSPFEQFSIWFQDALHSSENDPNAMTLATANKNAEPSSRIVLLKEVSNEEFIFFTNYNSKKGKDILENPKVALSFFWSSLERQVHIRGSIEKISAQAITEYFHSRPRQAQIGAHASNQSERLKSRDELEQKVLQITDQYKDRNIPVPEHWGGYKVSSNYIEFWQGRESRLHDRILYERQNAQSPWKIARLFP